jgi:hypothetical protein
MTELYEILKAIKGVRVSDPIAAMMGRSLSGGYTVCESELSVTLEPDTNEIKITETNSPMNKWVSGYDYILRNSDIRNTPDPVNGTPMTLPAGWQTIAACISTPDNSSLCRQKPRESG